MNHYQKKIILFDIDYTLFNAQHFRESFMQLLANRIPHSNKNELLTILQEVYDEEKMKTSFFDPRSFLALLEKRIPYLSDKNLLEKAIMNEALLEEALYKESKEVLSLLAKNNDVLLGIFSWGNIPVQKAKIKLLDAYFHREHIHIVEFDKKNALPNILAKYHNWDIYLIDDYQEVLLEAKKLLPEIHTIWIKRPETEGKREIFDYFTPDSIIRSLSEIIPYFQGKQR